MSGLSALEASIHALAAEQHGLVGRRQLLALGLGEDAVDHRIGNGRLIRVRRGVYALGPVEVRREAALLAEILAFGDAVASHRSAAALWQLRPWGGRLVEITRPGQGGVKRARGRVIHKSSHLGVGDVTKRRGVPTTTVERTLVDLATVVEPHHLRRAVEGAVQTEVFDLRSVQRTLDAQPGRRGRRALIALLTDMGYYGETTTRSDLEAQFLQLIVDHGLPRPQVNRYDGTRESDFRWPARRLIVEIDSWTFHGRTRRAFDADRARDRALLREGWRVARFTDRQIRSDPLGVIAELEAMLLATGT